MATVSLLFLMLSIVCSPMLQGAKKTIGKEERKEYAVSEGDTGEINMVSGMSILHKAVLNGNSADVVTLIKDKKLLEKKTPGEFSPLFIAASDGCFDLVKELLAAGADTQEKNGSDEWTALHAAACQGCVESIHLLIEADEFLLDTRSLSGNTPLHYAAINGKLDGVKKFIEAGAVVDAKNGEGHRPLDITENKEVMLCLQGRGADESPILELDTETGTIDFEVSEAREVGQRRRTSSLSDGSDSIAEWLQTLFSRDGIMEFVSVR